MKRRTAIGLAMASIVLMGCYAQAQTAINGAGASFPLSHLFSMGV